MILLCVRTPDGGPELVTTVTAKYDSDPSQWEVPLTSLVRYIMVKSLRKTPRLSALEAHA